MFDHQEELDQYLKNIEALIKKYTAKDEERSNYDL